MEVRFRVLSHQGDQLSILRKYASLWRRSDGVVGGVMPLDSLREAHGDVSLLADDHLTPWPSKHLVIRIEERK